MNQNYYFHYTKEEHLDSILKNGLVPTVGEIYSTITGHENHDPMVFLCREPTMSSRAADEFCMEYRDSWKHEEVVILTVNMEGLEEHIYPDDGSAYGNYYSPENPGSIPKIVKTPVNIEPWRIVDWMYAFKNVVCECGAEVYDYHPDEDGPYGTQTRIVGRDDKTVIRNRKLQRVEVTYDCHPDEWPEDMWFEHNGRMYTLSSFPIEFKCPNCGKKIETLNVD